MINCIKCEKFPKDISQIPSNWKRNVNTYKVFLLTTSLPNPMPQDGGDVQELNDQINFAYGSVLYIAADPAQKYIYTQNGWAPYLDGLATSIIIDQDGTVHV